MSPTITCMVNADGHVSAIANGPGIADRIRHDVAVLAECGVPGWTITQLPAAAAVEAMFDSLGCPACRIVFSCGCDIELIAAGGCPHDTAREVYRASQAVSARTGYRLPWVRT